MADASRKRPRDDISLPLAGRVILITGGGGGIGRAAALALARRGASVVAADVHNASAVETAALVDALETAATCLALTVDVADEQSVNVMISDAVAHFGRIDCALNAAGIEGERATVHESSVANFDRVMGTNLKGVFLCMRAEIAQMLKQQPAADDQQCAIDALNYSIVNVSSSAGQAGMPEFACYSASKHAINGLTRSASKEYAARGIRVNALCPSTTATPMVERFAAAWPEWQAKQNASFPVGRIGSPEEVARVAAFLFGSDCPMMTGACLTIDGGLSA